MKRKLAELCDKALEKMEEDPRDTVYLLGFDGKHDLRIDRSVGLVSVLLGDGARRCRHVDKDWPNVEEFIRDYCLCDQFRRWVNEKEGA